MSEPGQNNIRSFCVGAELDGMRLDAAMAAACPEISRSAAARLIEEGRVGVDGNPARKASRKVRTGETVVFSEPAPEPLEAMPENIALDVLFEDSHIIVIAKPAGLVVHPAPGHFSGTLVNALLAHCHDLSGIGGKARPGIVHRLDRDTSGVIVAAKNDAAHLALARQFAARQARKIYLALVSGNPREDSGVIDLPIGRHPADRKKMAVVQAGRARNAETRWKVRARYEKAALLEVLIKTGRTHQIRVHMAAIRHPVLGDAVYGPQPKGAAKPPARQMLHAWKLSLAHPATGEAMSFTAPVPSDMEEAIKILGGASLESEDDRL